MKIKAKLTNKIIRFYTFIGIFTYSCTLQAGPIEDLQPGHWVEIPATNLSQVYPSPRAPGNTGPKSVMKTWGGGAYDTKRDRLIIWGGGHRDYSGNEIYMFDVNSLSWERLTEPSSDVGGTEVGGLYPDGLPRSRHTYNRLAYAPNVDKFFNFGGWTYPSSSVRDHKTHSFDFDSCTWDSTNAEVPSGGSFSSMSAYNPSDGAIWYHPLAAGSRLMKYDPVSDTWRTFAKTFSPKIYATAAIDPSRNIMVSIGSYSGSPQVYKWDLNSPDNAPVDLVPLTSGDTSLEGAQGPGFQYDLVSDKFVAWDGGADVYLLDPDTWVWAKVSLAATNTVIPTSKQAAGTYGRFRYIPSKNVFIAVNRTSENVYFFRLTSGTYTSFPTLSFTAAPTSITSGDASTLTWSSADADSCTASGDWSSTRTTLGSSEYLRL